LVQLTRFSGKINIFPLQFDKLLHYQKVLWHMPMEEGSLLSLMDIAIDGFMLNDINLTVAKSIITWGFGIYENTFYLQKTVAYCSILL